MISFKLIFVYGFWLKSSLFAYGYPLTEAQFVMKIILSPLNFPGKFIKNELNIYVWVFIWTLYSNELLSIFTLTYCLDHSFKISLEMR